MSEDYLPTKKASYLCGNVPSTEAEWQSHAQRITNKARLK
jgi:hypothetical protein